MRSGEFRDFIRIQFAVYIGFLIAYFLGLGTTASVSVTALLIVLYSGSLLLSTKYGIKRFFVQVLAAVISPILLVFVSKIPFLPEYQLVPITVVLGVWVCLIINKIFKIGAPMVMIVIPVCLVAMTTPDNSSYPFLRVAGCLIGTLLGFAIDKYVLPVHHGKAFLHTCRKIHRNIVFICEDVAAHSSFSEEDHQLVQDTLLLIETTRTNLEMLGHDYKFDRKYRDYKDHVPFFRLLQRTNRTLLELLLCISASPATTPEYRDMLIELYRRHHHFIAKDVISISAQAFPALCFTPTNNPEEIPVLYHLINYYNALKKTEECFLSYFTEESQTLEMTFRLI